jgi:hypothetical protein
MKSELVEEAKAAVRQHGDAGKAYRAVPADRVDLKAAIDHLYAGARGGVIRLAPTPKWGWLK